YPRRDLPQPNTRKGNVPGDIRSLSILVHQQPVLPFPEGILRRAFRLTERSVRRLWRDLFFRRGLHLARSSRDEGENTGRDRPVLAVQAGAGPVMLHGATAGSRINVRSCLPALAIILMFRPDSESEVHYETISCAARYFNRSGVAGLCEKKRERRR